MLVKNTPTRNIIWPILSTYLNIRDGPEPEDRVGPGRGGAQPDEGQHCGDDQVVLGVALLLVQVQVRVEDIQGQAAKRIIIARSIIVATIEQVIGIVCLRQRALQGLFLINIIFVLSVLRRRVSFIVENTYVAEL